MKLKNVEDVYPLSPLQQGMLFHTLYSPDAGMYFTQVVLTLEGQMDVAAFQGAWQRVVERHSILRTAFLWEELDEPLQVVRAQVSLPWSCQDWQDAPEVEQQARLEDLLTADRANSFDLARAPLMRFTLLRLSEERHWLLWSSHHILLDGWSVPLLLKEALTIYETEIHGETVELPQPRPFRDYIAWLEQQDLAQAEAFWRKRLQGFREPTRLPVERGHALDEHEPVSAQRAEAPAPCVVTTALDLETTAALQALARQHHLTLNVILQGAWAVLLSRYTRVEDVVFGATYSGRPASLRGVENMVGLFINTLPVCVQVTPDEPVIPWLQELQERQAEMQQYEYSPLVKIQTWSDVPRDLPLFDTLVVFENFYTGDAAQQMGGSLRLSGMRNVERTNYPLNVSAAVIAGQLHLTLPHDPTRYAEDTIQRLAGHLKNLLAGIAATSNKLVGDLPLLDEAELRQILVEFNTTHSTYMDGVSLLDMFERQAAEKPENIALIEADRQMTYAELNRRANQLAHYLRGLGVGPEVLVGVCLERSMELVVTMLAVLKAGGVYFPLDTQNPGPRILGLLNDSQTSILLTHERIAKALNVPFTWMQDLQDVSDRIVYTAKRPQIQNLDALPFPDRSLVNYEKYNQFIGVGCVKRSISILATRGCPYNCAYCSRLWPRRHVARSAQNIFDEVRCHYDRGYTTFSFLDDAFNIDRKNSEAFFNLVLQHNLKLRLLFPSGLRGDILTPDTLDLMAEAGVIQMALALETASPRLQRLINKNLDIDRLHDNLNYLSSKHPHIIIDLFTMFGFPSETEDEVRRTYDFIRSIRWLHFPYVFALKIYPHTDMADIAMQHGIAREAIEHQNPTLLAYHKPSDTLPFSKAFAREYQARFMNEYFLLPERLQAVIPLQKQSLTREEITAKYNSYLPGGLQNYPEVERLIGSEGFYSTEPQVIEERPSITLATPSTPEQPAADGLCVLLLDLSQLFSADQEELYNVVETPMGLMALMTYLKQVFGSAVVGKIAKSGIDFDSLDELKALLDGFRPQLIGIRTLSLYKDFFHQVIALISQWYPDVTIIAGGPYPSCETATVLSDPNVDVVIQSEGEHTLAELVEKMIQAGGKLPEETVLREIAGLAFIPHDHRTARVRGRCREIVLLDRITERLARESAEIPVNQTPPDAAAYMIYTSGSTGRPKGTLITYGALAQHCHNVIDNYHYIPGERMLQFAAPAFDGSIEQVLPPLAGGITLLMLEHGLWSVEELHERIVKHGLTIVNLPPAYGHQLVRLWSESPEKVSQLKVRMLIVGGDVLLPETYRMWRKTAISHQARFLNAYGPTEATVTVTTFDVDFVPDGASLAQGVPIGRPYPNRTLYVLDPCGNPTPIGVPGELHIGGFGLARGYLNRPALTAEKFVPDPFSSQPGGRLYRTGDLARFLPGGVVEFLGRSDHQVKLRGFRIELGEIEAVLSQHPAVRQAAVIALDGQNGEKRLVAYMVMRVGELDPAFDADAFASELRQFIGAQLPDYMVPSVFLPLDAMPVTIGGKIDRRALPIPGAERLDLAESFIAPRNELEAQLAEIWEELLDIHPVGVTHNFFELGGHSLLATQLFSRIRAAFQVDFPLAVLFASPTIEGLANAVMDSLIAGADEETLAAALGEMDTE